MCKRMILLGALFVILVGCSDEKPSDPVMEDRENIGLQELNPDADLDSLVVGSINMTVGWNAEDLILKDLSDSATVYSALFSLYNQFVASEPSLRMRTIAAIIVANPVDVIALQETQVMRAGDTTEFHFVDSLVAALKVQGDTTKWNVIRQAPMSQITLDIVVADGSRMDIDFWEGNALLVREGISIMDSYSEQYNRSATFQILGNPENSSRGFQRVRLQTPGGAVWQIYNTHLEVERLSMYTTVQGQALNQRVWDDWQELGDATQIVVGDLNSKPGISGMLALTSEATGLVDVWNYSQDPDSLGYTCCIARLDDPAAWYNRRIDYILARNFLDVPQMERIPLWNGEFWGGDHAMLRAVLRRQVSSP